MTFNAFLFQALNGLSTASGLFFVAAGLSLIFGVTRIINIAHGSLYMLGTYIAYTFATQIGGALGFWGGIVATALLVGLIGALIEIVLLRRIYRAPGTVPVARDLRAGAGHQRRRALAVGAGRSARSARARPARRHRGARPPAAELRPVPDRHRSAGAAGPAFRAGAHALRPAGARGDAGPRNGRRARRQPGGAVHGRVRARRRCSPASAARCRSRASRPISPPI